MREETCPAFLAWIDSGLTLAQLQAHGLYLEKSASEVTPQQTEVQQSLLKTG